MRRALKSPVFWILMAVLQIYWIGFRTLETDVLNELLIGTRFAMAGAISVVFWKPSWIAIRSKNITGEQQLILGIWCSWASIALLSGWSLVHRMIWGGAPTNSALVGFLLWFMLIGATLHLTAPQTYEGHVMGFKSWWTASITLFIGIFLALIVLMIDWGYLPWV